MPQHSRHGLPQQKKISPELRDRFAGRIFACIHGASLCRCGQRLGIQSTPEFKILPRGVPAISAPLRFELHKGSQVIILGAIGPLKRLHLLIDTGFIPSLVDRRIAKKLGLEVRQNEMVAFGKKTRVAAAMLPGLRFGTIRSGPVMANVGDLSSGHGVDAIIGLDVLWRNSFRIDYKAREVTFGPVTAPEAAVRLDVTPPSLAVQLGVEGRPVRLLVDSGSRPAVFFERRVRDRLPALPVHGEQVIYRIAGANHIRRVNLHLDAGGISIEDFDGFLSDAPVDGYPPEMTARSVSGRSLPGASSFDLDRGRLGFGQ